MSDKVLPGKPPIALHLRRSAQARRLSLRISQLDGRVTLTLPRNVPETAALDFAREKENWIRDYLARRGADVVVTIGARLPLGGVSHEIVPGRGRRISVENGQIRVPGPPERVASGVAAFLKARAKVQLAAASHRYATQLGKDFSAISLRDTRSRWGSCTSAGRLMYSWRLVMAPPAVLDYVAAHEVAHLAEMNHSPAFWAHVEALYGDYGQARAWLRTDGTELHRYCFT